MTRKCELDNKVVIAPNASLIGFGTLKVKRDSFFTYQDSPSGQVHIARSLGRIAWVDNDGVDCRGYVCALVMSDDHTHAFERWVNPDSILQVFTAPTKLAEFFFAPKLPYATDMVRNLAAYGTLSDRYIGNAEHHVEAWQAGVSPAVYPWKETGITVVGLDDPAELHNSIAKAIGEG